MPITFIENAALRAGVAVHFGARVVSLIDKASGREWMTQGGESANTGEDARYSFAEAVGWDECFPTVSRWDAGGTPWGRNLRDHGDLWGRPATLDAQTGTSLAVSFSTPEYRFARRLELDGNTLVARYAAENHGDRPLPYLWALHALLAADAGDRMLLPGIDTARAVYLSGVDRNALPASLPWHTGNPLLPFPLAEVQPRSANFAAKLYTDEPGDRRALVGRDGSWLELNWDNTISHLGIWLTYGAWPQQVGGHQEVAIEPTNTPADHLGQAIEQGAAPLAPGEQRRWWVRFTVRE